VGHFCPSNPDPLTRLNPDPIRIRFRNPGFYVLPVGGEGGPVLVPKVGSEAAEGNLRPAGEAGVEPGLVPGQHARPPLPILHSYRVL
jgi:hypothetical protein